MVLLICVLLAVFAIGFTLLVRERDIPPAPVENPELRHLETRRQVLYDNLKDLQFEYHQGKLSEADYQSLKQGFLYDLAGVMDSIERLEVRKGKPAAPSHPPAPAARSKRKPDPASSAPGSNICPACQGANPAGNRYCGHCGQALQQ